MTTRSERRSRCSSCSTTSSSSLEAAALVARPARSGAQRSGCSRRAAYRCGSSTRARLPRPTALRARPRPRHGTVTSAVAAAVRLYVDRATHVLPAFALTDRNAHAVGPHLPGARRPSTRDRARCGTRALLSGPRELATRLGESLALLTRPRTRPPRAATLATRDDRLELPAPRRRRAQRVLPASSVSFAGGAEARRRWRRSRTTVSTSRPRSRCCSMPGSATSETTVPL